MIKNDFYIGLEFYSGDKLWRCTDVGSRVVIAICLSDHLDDSSWFNGPPYALAESVFDEHDQEGCNLTQDEV